MNSLVTQLFLLGIVFNTVYSQNHFPDENAFQKWEYVNWYFWGGKCEARILKTGEKVSKCGMKYIEVFDCNENESDCILMGYYRLLGDSVLVRTNHAYLNGVQDTVVCDEPEGLMYDFSTEKGDTMVCQINSTWPATFTKFWVKEKTSIAYEGTFRHTTTLDFIPQPISPDFLYKMKWIDGIGSNLHPFYSFACIGDHCELEQQVYKVFRNKALIYQDTMLHFSFPCTNWISSNKNIYKIEPILNIFPSPAESIISIRSNLHINETVNLKLCDVQGRALLFLNQHKIGDFIDIQHLSTGIYIIQVMKGNQILTTKFIKI